MFGIDDPLVALAYLLCILSTILCVTWGLVNWNKGDEPVQQEDRAWAEKETKVEKDL